MASAIIVRGLRQADVADASLAAALRELREGDARADLALQGLAPLGGVHDAQDAHRAGRAARPEQGDRQLVHDEAGVHAGAEEDGPVAAREPIEASRDRRVLVEGIRELLASRDDGGARSQRRGELALDVGKVRAGRMDDDVRRRGGEHGPRVGADPDADPIVTPQLADVPAREIGTGIDGAHESKARPLRDEPRERDAHGSEAPSERRAAVASSRSRPRRGPSFAGRRRSVGAAFFAARRRLAARPSFETCSS
jgi:hypothetical protein